MFWEIYIKIIEICVTLVTLYHIVGYLKLWITHKKKRHPTGHRKSSAASPKRLDSGFLATVLSGWKSLATLWDDVPAYKRILDGIDDDKVHAHYYLNWGSAGRMVVCSDLETVKQELLSSEWLNCFQNDHYVRIGTFNKSVRMGDDLYYREARRAFDECNLFKTAHVQSLYTPEIKIMLEKLRSQSSNRNEGDDFIISPSHLFANPIIHVAFQLIFGRRLLESDPIEGTLVNQMYHSRRISLGSSALDFSPLFKYFHYLRPSCRAYMKLCRTIDNITTLERSRRTEEPSCSSCPRDVMDSLLKMLAQQDGGNPNHFTFENLQVTIRDLILGSDTTNVALQHMILFMATHQDKQEMVFDEIDHFIVEHSRCPTYEDINRMIYTQAMLLEALRLGSIVRTISLVNNQDCTIGDTAKKKGTCSMPTFVGCHRSIDYWEVPLEFWPERFISDDKKCITNAEKLLPFSYGPRACPGELIGRIGMFMIAVALLREFKWEESNEHPPPSTKCFKGLTQVPAPYHVKLTPRAFQYK